VSLDVLTVAFVPPKEDGGGDVDRRECTRDDTDEEREGEILHDAGAEDEECESGEEGGNAGHDGAREHAINSQIDDVAQVSRRVEPQLFTDTVEHDDSVID